MEQPWKNLEGPARQVAISATVLLVTTGMLGVEAGILIVLGPARDVVLRPFVLLGYLEICAAFFALLYIVTGLVGLIFYRPYLYVKERIYLYRAQNAPEVSDEHTYFEDVRPAPAHNPHEDGVPD